MALLHKFMLASALSMAFGTTARTDTVEPQHPGGCQALPSLLQSAGSSLTCIAASLINCQENGNGQLAIAQDLRDTMSEVRRAILDAERQRRRPRHCRDLQLDGDSASGVRRVFPFRDSPDAAATVYCDQETDGGGWTVMLRRQTQPSQLDFRQNWRTYASGFGDPNGEYWIGLETLHQLTKDSTYALRVDMAWEDEDASSLYDSFSVGPEMYERRGYELQIGGYNKSSTGGDAMEYHNGMDFSTYDEDNDGASGGSCSDWSGGGGWWYNYCYYSNPTGIYPPADLPAGAEVDHLLEWRKWQGYYTYLSSLTMKIRPNYLPSIQRSSF